MTWPRQSDPVTWLRSSDADKILNPGIQVKRICIGIPEPCYCVDFVNQMRTIGAQPTSSLTCPCGGDNGFALSWGYCRGHGGSSGRWRSTLSEGD